MAYFWRGIAYGLDGNAHVTGNIAVDVDELEAGLFQILNTSPGERVHEPEFGSRLKELVFEPRDEFLGGELVRATRDAINRWEDRIRIVDVQVEFPENDEHSVFVILRYEIKVGIQVVRTLKVRVS